MLDKVPPGTVFYNAPPARLSTKFFMPSSRSSNFYKQKKKTDFTGLKFLIDAYFSKKVRPKKRFAAPEKLILPLLKKCTWGRLQLPPPRLLCY